MIIISNFFPQIYLKRQQKLSAMQNHSHIHLVFMLLSIIDVKFT